MPAKAPNVSMRRRTQAISIAMVFVITGILIARLAYLQLFQYEKYQQKAAQQQFKVTSITPSRGAIYDSLGNELAKSATVWTVYVVPVDIETKEEAELIAEGLSEILGVDEETVYEKTQVEKSYYQIIKKRIEQDEADQVRQFILDNDDVIKGGIRLEEDVKRYYPYGNLASTVLGFVGDENSGLYGIEAYYNDTLSGTPGRIVSAKNGYGTDMPYKYEQMYEAEDGQSLVLTINSVIQLFVEKHLEAAVKEYDVQNRAACIVMEIKTGRILAMTTKPDFDPNAPFEIYDPDALELLATLEEDSDEYWEAYGAAQQKQWRNKAVSDPYEPGSVFKLITSAIALEEGVCNEKSSFTCDSGIYVANNFIKCWKHPESHGTQNFVTALCNSCNPAFIQMGQRIGGSLFYKYFTNFGLTSKTSIDIPGEASSITHSESRLTDSLSYLSSSSFGQTFKVTPIQLITAVSAAIGGGNLMRPYIVEQILDADGNIVESTKPTVVRQVISAETSKLLAEMAEAVVVDGSGKHAQVKGYRIGGKTGTSEKLDAVDEEGNPVDAKVSSFFGFAPADNPQIAVLLLLDEANTDSIFGSVIAAPVVGKILGDILPYLGIEPQYTEEELATLEVKVPYLLDQTPFDAEVIANQAGIDTEVVGDGERVIQQIPAAGEPIPKDGTIVLYTTEESLTELVTVPNVLDLSGQAASQKLKNESLNIKVVGMNINERNIVAISQTPEAGTEVLPGTVVTVEFISTEEFG